MREKTAGEELRDMKFTVKEMDQTLMLLEKTIMDFEGRVTALEHAVRNLMLGIDINHPNRMTPG